MTVAGIERRVLGVIALGGGLGALARYGLAQALPSYPGQFPWATFATNVLGCLLIGVLMVVVTEIWQVHSLLRPFLGIGFLGGFTTFSTYAVEIRGLLHRGTVGIALVYLVGTLLGAMMAVLVAVRVTRRIGRRRA
jgi:CrcB protein